MPLSRKHYQQLAEVLAGYVKDGRVDDELLNDIECWLKRDNDRFDWRRFEEACGVNR